MYTHDTFISGMCESFNSVLAYSDSLSIIATYKLQAIYYKSARYWFSKIRTFVSLFFLFSFLFWTRVEVIWNNWLLLFSFFLSSDISFLCLFICLLAVTSTYTINSFMWWPRLTINWTSYLSECGQTHSNLLPGAWT